MFDNELTGDKFMSMAGYTKLFSSILASTIWREDNETRIVWITLLAMADKNGVAETSIPGLADMARVSVTQCEAALEKLKAPDRYSRTKEHEGRRIAECEGGFFLLNHSKYREKMSADERREYNRIKQKEHRQKLSINVKSVNDISTMSAHTEAEAKALTQRGGGGGEVEFISFWGAYPRKVAKPTAYRAFQKARHDTAFETIMAALDRQKKSDQWIKGGGRFIPHPATWLNQSRWLDETVIIAARRDKMLIPSREMVYEYAKEKGDTTGVAIRFYDYWASKNFQHNGRNIDWKIEFSKAYANHKKE